MLDKEYKTYLELSEGQGLDRRVELAFVWQQKGRI